MPFVPEFTQAEGVPTGKRAECVAGMIKMLIEEAPDPIPWSDLCDGVGMEHHGQLMPAMHALELVGAVDRHTYVEPGSTRAKVAFSLGKDVEVKGE